ncbi:MAG: hypothetical protein OQK69_00845, partial [Gammaproteobacteria bacterium]|nr:hypothetical protein [Gammaproteobacteria bacterium]
KLRPVPDQARAGQMARVHFKSPAVERLVIPANAIHHDIDGTYTYIINDKDGKNIAQKRLLKKGLQFRDWIEIISGIEIGDRLITKGFLGLRDGKVVTIVEPETDSDSSRSGNSTP